MVLVPAAATTQPASLEVGQLLARRYRAVRPVCDGGRVWLAHDEALARPVAIKVLPAGDRAAAALLRSAALAAAVEVRPLARVYDAAVEPLRRGTSVVYVVGEWVAGRDLPQVLAAGPVPPERAVALTRTAAGALQALHAAGLVHGRLHPGNVILAAGGELRLTDAVVGAAVHNGPDGRAAGGPDGRAAGGPDGSAAGGPDGDARDLAALLYALLTGCWPTARTPQPARGLRPAPLSRWSGRPRTARQVQRRVPRRVAAVAEAGLDDRGAPRTVAALVDALDAADPRRH